jgi:NitT/TauT family transport system permease protein
MASLRQSGTWLAEIGTALGGAQDRTLLLRKALLPIVALGFVFWGWTYLVDAKIFPTVVLPPPADVLVMLQTQSGFMIPHAERTFFECLAGFWLAAVCGVGLSMLVTVSRVAREMLYPNLVLFQLIPTIALAPLFVLWFGIGTEARLAYAMCLGLFPIVVASSTGLMNTSPYFVRLCDSLTASRWQILFRVRLPFALPHIFTGLRIGLTLAIIGVVVGEFITAQAGIGYVISFASSSLETALALAAILYLLVVGLLLFLILMAVEFVVNRIFSTES